MYSREAPLAERVVGVLEVLLRSQTDYETDFCVTLRPALLQALQRFSVDSMGHELGQGHTAQGKTHNSYRIYRFFLMYIVKYVTLQLVYFP